jgi:hypothetical protein
MAGCGRRAYPAALRGTDAMAAPSQPPSPPGTSQDGHATAGVENSPRVRGVEPHAHDGAYAASVRDDTSQ